MAATAGQDRSDARSVDPGGRPRVLLWVLIGVAVAALVIGAVAGALREPAELPADSPEGVVQAYLQAVLDGDVTAARGYLAATTAERCTAGDYRQAWVPESLTATLDEVTVADGGGSDEAEVDVRLRTVAGPEPFGGGDFSSLETFVLMREDGTWQVTGEPWPVFSCGAPR
jgi:hypothetical protein